MKSDPRLSESRCCSAEHRTQTAALGSIGGRCLPGDSRTRMSALGQKRTLASGSGCPLCPRKRTFVSPSGTSAMCRADVSGSPDCHPCAKVGAKNRRSGSGGNQKHYHFFGTRTRKVKTERVNQQLSGEERCGMKLLRLFAVITALSLTAIAQTPAQAQQKQPNIVVIWGDDIGFWNISAYSRGMMGYQTPNIDRIANEGALFTDTYAQQSCTAGRAAFILGQSPFRTGLLTIGVPVHHRASPRTSPPSPNCQASWLYKRPVWQEPPRRSRRAFAHQSWLR